MRADSLSCLDIPEDDWTARCGADDEAAVGRESGVVETGRIVILQRSEKLACFNAPEQDVFLIAAGAEKRLVVRRKRDGRNKTFIPLPFMPLQRVKMRAFCSVPDADGRVVAAAGDQLAVGRIIDRWNKTFMLFTPRKQRQRHERGEEGARLFHGNPPLRAG